MTRNIFTREMLLFKNIPSPICLFKNIQGRVPRKTDVIFTDKCLYEKNSQAGKIRENTIACYSRSWRVNCANAKYLPLDKHHHLRFMAYFHS